MKAHLVPRGWRSSRLAYSSQSNLLSGLVVWCDWTRRTTHTVVHWVNKVVKKEVGIMMKSGRLVVWALFRVQVFLFRSWFGFNEVLSASGEVSTPH